MSSLAAATRVLGVDPGLRIMGWAVVERKDESFQLVAAGTIRPPVDDPVAARLEALHRGLTEVLEQHAPQAAAVEEAFGGKNIRSALRLGEARGVALLAAQQGGCQVHEIPPALVKKAVAGHGRAGKETVREAVLRALALEPTTPQRAYDETDAMALALTALTRLLTPDPLLGGIPLGRRQRGRRGKRWTAKDLEGLVGRED